MHQPSAAVLAKPGPNLLISVFFFCAILTVCVIWMQPYWLTVFAVCAFLLILSIVKPETAFALFIFTLAWEQWNVRVLYFHPVHFTYYPYMLVLPFAAIGLCVNKMLKNEPLVHYTPLDPFILKLFFLELISTLWAVSLSFAVLSNLFLVFNIIIYFLVTSMVYAQNKLRMLLNFMIIAGYVVSACIIINQWYDKEYILKLFQHVKFYWGFSSVANRYSGFCSGQHGSGYLVFTLFMVFSAWIYAKTLKEKIFYFVTSSFFLCALMLAMARAAFLGMLICLPFFVYKHPALGKVKLKVLSAAFALVIITLFSVNPSFIERMLIPFGYSGELVFSQSGKSYVSTSSFKQTSGQSVSFGSRVLRFKKAFWYLGDHPEYILSGLGAGGFTYLQTYDPEITNIPLSFFFDMGIIGIYMFFAFLFIIFKSYRLTSKLKSDDYVYSMFLATFCGVIAIVFVNGQLDYDWYALGSKFIFFYLAVYMSCVAMVNKKVYIKDEYSFSAANLINKSDGKSYA